MKRTLTLFAALVLLAVGAAAQKLSYSAVVRNSANELMANKTLTVGITITNEAPGATVTPVYSETQTVTTNQNGLVTLMIGDGTNVTGSLSDVTWQTAYITSDYTMPDNSHVLNTTPVTAVPYALYAEKSGSSATASANISDGNVNVSMSISDFVNSLTEDEKLALCAALGCPSGGGGDTPGGGDEPTTFFCGISTVEDVDHNIYHTVKIGNQCWLKENMRATHYSPNLPDPLSLNQMLMETQTAGAPLQSILLYSAPGSHGAASSDPNLVATYGLLYNWVAAVGSTAIEETPQGICPDGWHIPSSDEFQTMLTSAGLTGTTVFSPANKLTTGEWNPDNTAGAPGNASEQSNTSGFSALPAGIFTMQDYNHYQALHKSAIIWSSTVVRQYDDSSHPAALEIDFDNSETVIGSSPSGGIELGASVRCVKDN